jgi:hypothetical protein
MRFAPQTPLPSVPAVSPGCRVGTAHQRRLFPYGSDFSATGAGQVSRDWMARGREVCSAKASRQGVIAPLIWWGEALPDSSRHFRSL